MLNLKSPRLPRLRYDRIGWVGFVAVSGVILLAAIGKRKATFSDEIFVEVQPLALSGEKLITEREVKTLLTKAFGGNLAVPMAELEVERVETALEQDPFVKNAEAYVDAHAQMHIRIEQREPIIRVMDDSGSNYYLDADGRRVPTSRNFTARCVVATGNLPPFQPEFLNKKKHVLKDLFQLHDAVQKDDFLKTMVQQIHYTTTGDFVLVPLIGDQKIIIGGIKNLDNKFWRLKTFYQEAMSREGFQKYETINLKYKNQVVCKK